MLFDKKYQNADLDCPRCKIVMKKLDHPSKATLDVCSKCGGMWLDRDEVKLLFKAEKQAQKEEKKEQKEEIKEQKEKIKKALEKES